VKAIQDDLALASTSDRTEFYVLRDTGNVPRFEYGGVGGGSNQNSVSSQRTNRTSCFDFQEMDERAGLNVSSLGRYIEKSVRNK